MRFAIRGRRLLIAAGAVYLLVLGCVMWPNDGTGPGATGGKGSTASAARIANMDGLPYRSVSLQIQRVDWIDKYKESIDEIAAIGADTVQFVIDTRQENGGSAKIYLDMRMTPTGEQLRELIQHAKSKNLRVILMPIVLLDKPRGGEWRGKILPASDNGGWETWWSSYRDMITHFAYIAEGNGVDVLVVGSELVSTENKIDQWTTTIQKVREIYHGRLTYSSNWDHYTSVPFWDQLDLIGMNSYWKMGENRSVSVEQVQENWQGIQKDLLPFIQTQGKPLILLEVGWCSMANMAQEPWNYTPDSTQPLDLELQRKLYEAFFESWHGKRELGGFSIWEWSPGNGGMNDKGYTPENKPAEMVLREWLAKPWAATQPTQPSTGN